MSGGGVRSEDVLRVLAVVETSFGAMPDEEVIAALLPSPHEVSRFLFAALTLCVNMIQTTANVSGVDPEHIIVAIRQQLIARMGEES